MKNNAQIDGKKFKFSHSFRNKFLLTEWVGEGENFCGVGEREESQGTKRGEITWTSRKIENLRSFVLLSDKDEKAAPSKVNAKNSLLGIGL